MEDLNDNFNKGKFIIRIVCSVPEPSEVGNVTVKDLGFDDFYVALYI